MKNYIHDIISRYIKHDYPKEVDQDFRAWLTDEEHTNEKEQTLNELWENTESVTTPDYQHSLERMHELTGIGTRRRIRTLHTRLVAWRVAAALLIARIFGCRLSGCAEPAGTGRIAGLYPYCRDKNITLPDGTQVMINSRSTLLYPQRFTGDTRCVYLVGEADFKVKRDERHLLS